GGTVLYRADYTYDVFGNRIVQAVDPDGAGPQPTTTTKSAFAGRSPWADLSSGLTVQTRYQRDGADQLTARSSGGVVSWLLTDRSGRDITDAIVSWLPDSAVGWLASRDSAWIASASNFAAGMGDTVSLGLTARVRQLAGYDDVVDYGSDAYRYGSHAGQAVNVGLMVVNPAGWAGAAVRGLNWVSAAGGAISAAEAAYAGDLTGAGLAVLNVGLTRLRGAG